MDHSEQYAKGIKKIQSVIDTDEETALAMIMLTATLMDLCPWDPEVVDIVIADCRREQRVDLRESEPCT